MWAVGQDLACKIQPADNGLRTMALKFWPTNVGLQIGPQILASKTGPAVRNLVTLVSSLCIGQILLQQVSNSQR